MSSFFDRLADTLKVPLSGFGISGIDQISARISQNLKNPIGSASTARSNEQSVWF